MENSISNTYHIEGMGCGACATTVEKILSSISGVTYVNIDLVKENAKITSNKEISTEIFQIALGNTAYSMEKFKEPKVNKLSESDENHKTPSNKPHNWVAPPYRSAVDSVRRRHNASGDVGGGNDGIINTGPVTDYEKE